MFVILQKYDFSSKSQRLSSSIKANSGCLWYCKSTIFQANHNSPRYGKCAWRDVCDTAKVRFFKQITTLVNEQVIALRCLWYCKSTIFQANHNNHQHAIEAFVDVCDTAKVRFFKQITTHERNDWITARCLWYCKSTIFQANHNRTDKDVFGFSMFVILQKYDFSSKSQPAVGLI